MNTVQRVAAFCNSVEYIESNNIAGAIVICGIWRGGIAMAAIDTLQKLNISNREIYLYDTFKGMITPATDYDVKTGGNTGVGKNAEELYKNASKDDYIFCYSAITEVKENINQYNYPEDKVHYIQGLVNDTIPEFMPKKIALLYFSISFYTPVLHTLTHLYPLLQSGGVLFVSDYGDWEGTKKAVDEFTAANPIKLLLNRIDSSGRIGIKL
ncbi:MAG TPA: TylF/MycF/NovP-related O-methyltransferase [Mucilaginibacter sp.]|nr:TylF/MycF/NovP-related O-methyltransferase [Mucilaginibacter sp.]